MFIPVVGRLTEVYTNLDAWRIDYFQTNPSY